MLTPVAAEQAGYVTSRQAGLVGIPAWVLLELTKRGLLRRIRRGVYMVEPGRAPSPYEDAVSAWLAVDGQDLPWRRRDARAIVSHASAAALRGMGTIVPGLPEITVRRHAERPDMLIHVLRFTPEDWEWLPLEGSVRLPTTTPARTIVDLFLANEEADYLERAIRESFPDAKAATGELTAAARRRRTRTEGLTAHLAQLAESAWPM